jgi:hypothetical protein
LSQHREDLNRALKGIQHKQPTWRPSGWSNPTDPQVWVAQEKMTQ